MQELNKRYPKNCLLTVLDRYSATVRNMEQVVMMPSLLRDLPPSEQGGQSPASAPDLYKYFTMLKAIHVDVDHGLMPREEWQAKVANGTAEEAEDKAVETQEAKDKRVLDLEAQFHLHFSSLHQVLTHLTLKAEEVTRRYQEITGQVM